MTLVAAGPLRYGVRNRGSSLDILASNPKDPLQKYQRRYGLSDAELGKISDAVNRRWKGWTHPDVDSTLTRLQDKLDLSDAEMKKILVGAPNVLSYGGSQDTSNLTSLEEFLQLSPAELTMVVVRSPKLLGCSWQDNMELMLTSLKEKCQLSPEELKELVLRKPILLGRRWDTNIGPQIAMMEKAVGHAGAAAEVKALIFSDPGVLTYSNEKRVRPRLAELKAVSQGVDRSMLSAVCNYTDARWEERMADIGRVGSMSQ